MSTYTIRRKADSAAVAVFFDQADADAAWHAYCKTFFSTCHPNRIDHTVRLGLPTDSELSMQFPTQCNPRPYRPTDIPDEIVEALKQAYDALKQPYPRVKIGDTPMKERRRQARERLKAVLIKTGRLVEGRLHER